MMGEVKNGYFYWFLKKRNDSTVKVSTGYSTNCECTFGGGALYRSFSEQTHTRQVFFQGLTFSDRKDILRDRKYFI